MVISIDEEAKVYISEIHSGEINIYNYFEIRSTCFEEKIVEVVIQSYGFIIIRTDYQRLLAFTYLWPYVASVSYTHLTLSTILLV